MPSLFEQSDAETQIWVCDPLIVVHPQDGVVFHDNTKVECVPDDRSGRTGRVRSLTASPDGWFPHLVYIQQIELLQTFDLRIVRRPGLILIGNDEESEPFTWYINGEADRFLLSGATTGAEPDMAALKRLNEIPIDRAGGILDEVWLLKVTRMDGLREFEGPAKILRIELETPEALAFVECQAEGSNGEFPKLYVRDVIDESNGCTWMGIDADGFPATWCINEAAEDLVEFLP